MGEEEGPKKPSKVKEIRAALPVVFGLENKKWNSILVFLLFFRWKSAKTAKARTMSKTQENITFLIDKVTKTPENTRFERYVRAPSASQKRKTRENARRL